MKNRKYQDMTKEEFNSIDSLTLIKDTMKNLKELEDDTNYLLKLMKKNENNDDNDIEIIKLLNEQSNYINKAKISGNKLIKSMKLIKRRRLRFALIIFCFIMISAVIGIILATTGTDKTLSSIIMLMLFAILFIKSLNPIINIFEREVLELSSHKRKFFNDLNLVRNSSENFNEKFNFNKEKKIGN